MDAQEKAQANLLLQEEQRKMDAMREAEAFQKSSNFAFDKWLEEHKIEDAKEVFIKHNMTTLNNLSMKNENFGSFISDHRLFANPKLIPLIVVAI
eukprot:456707_1